MHSLRSQIILLATAGTLLTAMPAALPAGEPTSSSTLAAPPGGFFRLAYCGSGRRGDPGSQLQTFSWDEAARAFDLTIVQSTGGDYRDFVESLVRRNPSHRVIFYVHAHGLYASDDRAGLLNLTESNYVHATDPASLRVLPTGEGLLVDWERDERRFYDEYDLISELREFGVFGYVVYRATGDGEFTRVWPEPVAEGDTTATLPSVAITQYLDRDVEPGQRYRYVVQTLGPAYREYPFSWPVGAVAGSPPPIPFVHEHQSVVEATPGASQYTGRFRIRVETPETRARLLIDRNADGDFTDAGEQVPMSPATESFVEAIVELDPRARTDRDSNAVLGFAYRLEFEAGGARVLLPEQGSYTTSINNRVRSSTYGFYVMRMATENWIDHLLRAIDLGARREGIVRGVFLDELVFDPAIGVDAVPIDWSAAEVVAGATAIVRAIRGERPELAVYMNGLQSLMFDASIELTPPAVAAIDSLVAAGVTGGMVEGFAVAPWHAAPGGRPWVATPRDWQAQQVIARVAEERGLELLLLARAPSRADARIRLFAYASNLLVREPGVEFGFMVDRCLASSLAEWGVDLGAPLELLAASDETVKGRRFEQGEVWVNPDPGATATVRVGDHLRRLVLTAGEEGPGSVTFEPAAGEIALEPQSAAILVRPGSQAGAQTQGAQP